MSGERRVQTSRSLLSEIHRPTGSVAAEPRAVTGNANHPLLDLVFGEAAHDVGMVDGIYTMDLDFPQQAAFGFAVRLGRPVLWTEDVKWINYSDTYDKAYLKGNFAGGNEAVLNFGWDDVWDYATGLQIDVTPNFAIRAGYNYNSSPIKTEDVDNNLAFPAIVKQRVAGGFTYRLGRHWELTMAYMKAFKEELTSPDPPAGSGTTISLEEQAADFVISYRF